MPLVLADVEDELKNRARVLGAFASSGSSDRLRYAIRKAAFQAWTKQDWDFKNSTEEIVTSAGNLGPYSAPSGLVRFASTHRKAFFGFYEKDVLVPILSTDVADFTPYIRVQDGMLFFVQDPGNQTLTLNYLASFSNSIEDAELTASLAHFDDGLNDAIQTLAIADLWKDLPGMQEAARTKELEGLGLVDAYWEDVTLDKYQKTIAPKGLNRVPVDFVARVVTVLGLSMGGTRGTP